MFDGYGSRSGGCHCLEGVGCVSDSTFVGGLCFFEAALDVEHGVVW